MVFLYYIFMYDPFQVLLSINTVLERNSGESKSVTGGVGKVPTAKNLSSETFYPDVTANP